MFSGQLHVDAVIEHTMYSVSEVVEMESLELYKAGANQCTCNYAMTIDRATCTLYIQCDCMVIMVDFLYMYIYSFRCSVYVYCMPVVS